MPGRGVGLQGTHHFILTFLAGVQIDHFHPGVESYLIGRQVAPHQHLGVGQGLLQLPDAALQLPAMDQGGLEIGIFLHPAFLGGLQDLPDYLGAFHLAEKLQLPDELLIAGPGQENLFHAT